LLKTETTLTAGFMSYQVRLLKRLRAYRVFVSQTGEAAEKIMSEFANAVADETLL